MATKLRMKMMLIMPPLAKSIGGVCFIIILCTLYLPAFAQDYTPKDSVSFKKELAQANSDVDRIYWELQLAEYSIKKPGSFKSDLDNASACINKAKLLNLKIKSKDAEGHIQLEDGLLLREYGPSPQGKALIEQAITLIKNSSDKCMLGGAYRDLANCYDMSDPKQKEPRIELIKLAVAAFKQCDNYRETGAALQRLAEAYLDTGNNDLCKKYIYECLDLYKANHYPKVQGLYSLLGDMYYVLSDYDKAVSNYFQSLTIASALKDSTMQTCETSNHMGSTLFELDQYKKSIPYFTTAMIIAEKHDDPNSVLIIAENIANSYYRLNLPKEALKIFDANVKTYKSKITNYDLKLDIDMVYMNTYSKLNDIALARPYSERLLVALNANNIDNVEATRIYNALCRYFFIIKDYKKASDLLVKSQKAVMATGIPKFKVINLRIRYQTDSALNDYKNAFTHLLQFKKIEDTILNEKKTKQVALLQNSYENQQKENEIRLKDKDIKLAQAQLKSVQTTRNVTFAGVLVFVLISGMTYMRYREKQKVNLLITDKNTALQKLLIEKEWLLKEVHHRVKNNLHTVICLLESQAAYLEDDALKAVESSQHRIFAMSLVHQRLYQSSDTQTVDIANYLSEFIMYLKESFGEPVNIIFQQEIESMRLDVAQAIPLALIVNEAVTNAIKYAFPENRRGVIRIALKHESDSVQLSIEDNGVGMPENVHTGKLSSLGLELIKGLTEDLKGKVQFLVQAGTSIVVSFSKDPYNSMAPAVAH